MTHIGIFDSGVGGLTVMKTVTEILPQVAVTYFGDTARLPYGEKGREAIIRFSRENIQFLESQGVNLIIVACHTASSLALQTLEKECKLPLIGMTELGVEKAVAITRNRRIAILGTRGTIGSGVYQEALKRRMPDATLVPIACPLFVPLVEERMDQDPITFAIAQKYLVPAKEAGVDTVILGCTHYPLLGPFLQQILGANVMLVDAAEECARLLSKSIPESKLSPSHVHRFFVSAEPDRFRHLGEYILNKSIGPVTLHASGAF